MKKKLCVISVNAVNKNCLSGALALLLPAAILVALAMHFHLLMPNHFFKAIPETAANSGLAPVEEGACWSA